MLEAILVYNHLANKDKLGVNCEKDRQRRKLETHEYSSRHLRILSLSN